MIAALVVGALTAWFLGLRLGIIAGVVTAVAMLVAMVVPGMTMTVYALVVVWCAGLYFFGKKISSITGQKGVATGPLATASTWAGQASTWVKKQLGSDKKA